MTVSSSLSLSVSSWLASSEVALAVLDRQFAGEEALGRYFDLVGLHEQFVNLPPRKFRGMNYLEYLDRFDKFELIPRPAKGDLYSKWVALSVLT